MGSSAPSVTSETVRGAAGSGGLREVTVVGRANVSEHVDGARITRTDEFGGTQVRTISANGAVS